MEVAKPSRGRQVVRWCLRALLALIVVAVALIASDSLHSRTCREGDLQGLVIEVPGERLQFLETGRQTNGQALSLDAVREPMQDPNYSLRREDGHTHPHQEERFKVIAGSARFLIGDREVVLTAGQTGVVPPNTLHTWMALDGKPVRVKAEFRPALDTGEWFHRLHGPLERGEMGLLEAAVIQSEYQGAVWPAHNKWMWKLLVKILAPIGRLLGYKAC